MAGVHGCRAELCAEYEMYCEHTTVPPDCPRISSDLSRKTPDSPIAVVPPFLPPVFCAVLRFFQKNPRFLFFFIFFYLKAKKLKSEQNTKRIPPTIHRMRGWARPLSRYRGRFGENRGKSEQSHYSHQSQGEFSPLSLASLTAPCHNENHHPPLQELTHANTVAYKV